MKNTLLTSLITIIYACLFLQCDSDQSNQNTSETAQAKPTVMIEKEQYGASPDGQNVDLYTLKNDNGIAIKIMTYGGIITSLKTPNRENQFEDIVLGFDSLHQYFEEHPYFGALIGRYGNRIAKGKFELEGTGYDLASNNGPNHLHGGLKGFDKVIWKAVESIDSNSASLKLAYLSKDMEEGYPGNLAVEVTYTLTDKDELVVVYEAITDKTTIINLTQHSYFNLSANFNNSILDHEIVIHADKYLPIDETLIPTGELADLNNTPFDFRKAKTIGQDIENDNEQLKRGGGYDHCWVLNEQNTGVRLAAIAYHPPSGRVLEVFTDEPGIQFYTGNFLDGTLPQKGGGTYARRTGFCLETQHYPDSPNQSAFPSVILKPGEKYRSQTTFRFTAI